jgi:hypothetical protein
MAKAKKKRAKHYEKPLKIQGSFADVIKVSVTNPDKPKEKAPKKKSRK